MHRRLVMIILAGTILACSGSSQKTADTKAVKRAVAPEAPINIVATTGMVADAVKNVGGQYVQVVQLMAAGVDPHLYKAGQGDISKLDEAEIIVYNGLNLEGKMGDIFVKMARFKPVVAVTERIDQSLLREPPEFAGHFDPHVWFDVGLWSKTLGVIADELSQFDPAHRDYYQQKSRIYGQQLGELHEWVKVEMARIPKEKRLLVTAHDAFGYFGKAYQVEVMGLQGISTVSEFGLKDVQRLVTLLVSRQIPAVFVESSIPKRSIEAVMEGVKARGHQVVIGGELYSDAMGAAGSSAETYIGMVKANVGTIRDALMLPPAKTK